MSVTHSSSSFLRPIRALIDRPPIAWEARRGGTKMGILGAQSQGRFGRGGGGNEGEKKINNREKGGRKWVEFSLTVFGEKKEACSFNPYLEKSSILPLSMFSSSTVVVFFVLSPPAKKSECPKFMWAACEMGVRPSPHIFFAVRPSSGQGGKCAKRTWHTFSSSVSFRKRRTH